MWRERAARCRERKRPGTVSTQRICCERDRLPPCLAEFFYQVWFLGDRFQYNSPIKLKKFHLYGARRCIASLSEPSLEVYALAADLPPSAPVARAPAAYVPAVVPVYNWTGFYIGLNAGYGFANTNSTATISGNSVIGSGTATGSNNLNGFAGGAQIGANWQWDAFVLGLEADFQGTSQSKTSSFACGAGCVITGTGKIPWFATLRGRAGVAMDRVLVYGTGGAVWLHASDKITASGGGITATLIDTSDTKTGWTAGAGVEVAFSQNWTARIEYLFVDVKPTLTAAVPAAIGGGTATANVTIKDSIIRAGVNFKFTP